MTGRLLRSGSVGLALSLGLLAGCTAAQQTVGFIDKDVPIGSFGLVAFDSCDQALSGLHAAAKSVVGPYGFWGGGVIAMEEGGWVKREAVPAPQAAAPGAADNAAGIAGGGTLGTAPAPNYSGTNNHEAAAEEPDLVKTDGRRIVTISQGVLRVVNAATHTVTGLVELREPGLANDAFRYVPADLLLSGNHALVLMRSEGGYGVGMAVPDVAPVPGAKAEGGAPAAQPGDVAQPRVPATAIPTTPPDQPIVGPHLLLVDLTDAPRILSSLRADGNLIDARQVGSVARVVLQSSPRLLFPYQEKGTDADRLAANKKIIDRSPIESWVPRLEVSTAGQTTHPRIGCDAISRPSIYTGTNVLTVLTVDLAADGLGDGLPTAIVADGNTVYSNGSSLYVASDQRWRAIPLADGAARSVPRQPQTEIYQFDISSAGRPIFLAGGSVPGYLLNQYAMSEWENNLRVATTTGEPWAPPGQSGSSQSSVYVLARRGNRLAAVSHIDGLGHGERIYAVRFVGTTGYVVTFKQTDPLYTLDLHDPAHPVVRGELTMQGYSAYLHPIDGNNKLIGVGQDATAQGRVTGTQVSLFDVANIASPKRLARYTVSGGHSEAEFDPHAFLYHEGLLVIPLEIRDITAVVPVPAPVPGTTGKDANSGGGAASSGSGTATAVPGLPSKVAPTVGALLLRIDGERIVELGFISHPAVSQPGYPTTYPGYAPPIRRSLIIDNTLWTLSDSGLLATDIATLTRVTWIRFT